MRIVGRTDKGHRRPDNQDRYVAGLLSNGTAFGFVADGMGGANGGSVASSHLCRIMEECLFTQNDNMAMDREKTVVDAIDVACSEIFHLSKTEQALSGMGTTICGVTVQNNICTVYNIGDSRVYILRDGVLNLVTEDHSVVHQLFRQGAITEEEMATHPQKNLITRAVGVRPNVETDVSELTLAKGDRILCASDGLTNFVLSSQLAEILSDDNFYKIPEKLIDAALEHNATDNITAVVLEY